MNIDNQTKKELIASVINILAKECNDYAVKKGFWKDEDDLLFTVNDKVNNIPDYMRKQFTTRILSLFNSEKVALEHSELSERLETLRKDSTKLDEHCPEFFNVEIEVADLIIRALDFAGRRKLRIGEALLAKMAFNETREYKHGKNF